jgi:hypothetical protein
MTTVDLGTALVNIRLDYPAAVIESFTMFDRIYPGTPDHVGEISVVVDDQGHKAIYGVTTDGQAFLYMD